jgi:hypothetical protein
VIWSNICRFWSTPLAEIRFLLFLFLMM